MSTERRITCLFFGALITILACTPGFGQPALELTSVPPYDSSEDLEGRAAGVEPGEAKVAVVIFVPGAGWWAKPTAANPLTSLRPDGFWRADITTGGADRTATKIAAFLVPADFVVQPILGVAKLPATLQKQALAKAIAVRVKRKEQTIAFCEHEWIVKYAADRRGPGPNYFSDSEKNVWVDDQDRLHLRITHRDGKWQCAEIISKRTFGYGTYTFDLDCSVEGLDPNIILGLFTWSDAPEYAHREIDIEISRWGDADNKDAQFVVQPYDAPEHMRRFRLPGGLKSSTHSFKWLRNVVSFRTMVGDASTRTDKNDVIHQWDCVKDVPQTGDENARMNLWLMRGQPPMSGEEAEIVVRGFEFVPAAKSTRQSHGGQKTDPLR